ncbi:MAG: hypothetical protein RR405_03675, partial [Clostridia bacterium]
EEELAGAILIDYRKLTISIGNILFRYVLDLIKIDGLDIKSLIYKDIEANVDVTLDLKNTINLYIDVALALDGDRYKEVARDNVVVDGVDDVTTATENEALYEYYIFEKDAADAKVKGTYAINEKGEYYALAKMANYTGDRYTKMLVVRVDNGTPNDLTDDKFYKVPYNTDVKLSGFVADAKGIYGYGEKAGLHKLTVDEIKEIGEDITKRFSIDPKLSNCIEITDPTTVIYKYVAGSDVNFNECDTALTLNLGIKDLDLGFTTRQTNVLSASELAEYTEVGAMDRLSLSETIDLSTSFKQGKDIDLKELLIFLFPDVDPANLVALIQAESDKGGDVDRVLELVITVEVKFAALLNMFKRYTYTGADDMFTKDITFVDIITLIKGALIDGKVPILELLDYVNASVELWTKTNRDMTTGVYLDRHKMLGIYLLCGTYSTLTADEMKDDNAIFVPEKDRYDHYFEIASGAYGVKLDANGKPTYSKIPTVGDTKGYVTYKDTTATHKAGEIVRFSYDPLNLYPNIYGHSKLNKGGLYVDLSYLDAPGITVDRDVLFNLIAGLLPATASSDAQTTAGETATATPQAEGGSKLPLLTEEIASYVRMFLYGIEMTSTYIKVLITADFINQILALVTPVDNRFQFDDKGFTNKPYLQINTDPSEYSYVPNDKATTEDKAQSWERFNVVENNVEGTYWLNGESGKYELRANMTKTQKEAYEKVVGYKYYLLERVETYILVGTGDSAYYTQFKRANASDKRLSEKTIDGAYQFYTLKDVASTEANLWKQNSDGTFSPLAKEDVDAYVENGGKCYNFTAIVDADCLYAIKSAKVKPFISLQLYLWSYELGINIHFPKLNVLDFKYIDRTNADGSLNNEDGTLNDVKKAEAELVPEGERYRKEEQYAFSNDAKDIFNTDYYTVDNGASPKTFSFAEYNKNPRYIYFKHNFYPVKADTT